MNFNQFVHAPRLWPPDHKHRRVTWMELFFDLIFVAAVAEVGKSFSADFSPAGLLRYAFLFVLIWWAWCGHTLYSTRFDTDDMVQRLLILLQSFIAAVMAANAKDALDSRSSAGFGAAYAGMRLVLVIQYLRARRIEKTRPLATRFAAGFGVAAIIWLISALTEAPARYWLWALAMTIDLATPWLAEKHGRNAPPHCEHFPERFGLFTIILLGEFVAEVMRGIESQEYWSLTAASTAFAGMTFAFGLWWCYFEGAKGASERHLKTHQQAVMFQIWNYAHLPLFVALGVAGIGFKHLIALQSDERLHHAEAFLLFAAVSAEMMMLTTIAATAKTVHTSRALARYLWPQYTVALAVMVVGPYGAQMHKLTTAAILLLSCIGHAILMQRGTLTPRLASSAAPARIAPQPVSGD
jgi:low temperature requirement protein LtrA